MSAANEPEERDEPEELRHERRERMEEARRLGEDIEKAKEATKKVQTSLKSLKEKLRAAEAEAAVDPSAAERAATLREMLATQEPRLVQLFDEKRQRYELDVERLKEVRREVMTLEHGEKKIEVMVQAEFAQWRHAVTQRYPRVGEAAAASGSSSAPVEVALLSVATARSPTSIAAAPSSTAAAVMASAIPGATTGGRGQASVIEHASAAPPQSIRPGEARLSPSGAVPSQAPVVPTKSAALAKAEAALDSLRRRLEEAKESGDTQRQQMLAQLLLAEEPRLERLRAGQG